MSEELPKGWEWHGEEECFVRRFGSSRAGFCVSLDLLRKLAAHRGLALVPVADAKKKVASHG